MRTPAKRTMRSYAAAMSRHLKSEAYRKVAASGGGARETARRAKRLTPKPLGSRAEGLRNHYGATRQEWDAAVLKNNSRRDIEVLIGKSHTANLASS